MTETITISCDDCAMQATEACEDCLVTFICGREGSDAVILKAAEDQVVRLLAHSGLVPRIRHARRGTARCV